MRSHAFARAGSPDSDPLQPATSPLLILKRVLTPELDPSGRAQAELAKRISRMNKLQETALGVGDNLQTPRERAKSSLASQRAADQSKPKVTDPNKARNRAALYSMAVERSKAAQQSRGR